MFEVGFSELLLVGIIALVVIGPERLPGLARTAGVWLGRLRYMLSSVKAEVEREMQLSELQQSLRQQAAVREVESIQEELKAAASETQQVVASSRAEALNQIGQVDPLAQATAPSVETTQAAPAAPIEPVKLDKA